MIFGKLRNQSSVLWMILFYIFVAVTRDGWTEMVKYYASNFERKKNHELVKLHFDIKRAAIMSVLLFANVRLSQKMLLIFLYFFLLKWTLLKT